MKNKILPLFTVLIFFLFSCNNKKEVITPEIRNITESVYASGFIKTKNQYEVFGRANGVIEKILVKEGTLVKKGDPIFQLDNKNLKIATENARLASATADYKTNADKLQDAEQSIQVASKKLKNDSLLYFRQKVLTSNDAGTKVDLEQKQLNYEASKVDYDKAKTNYEDLKRKLKLESAQTKNNLQIAEILEDDNIIRSEVDGVVYKINREVGELINSSDPAAIIGTDEFIIELNIDELDIVKVKKAQKVLVRMDSYKSEVFEAEIITIDPMMNSRTRSFQAEAIFTKKPAELFPNLTAEANILIETKQDVLTIPRNYLFNDTSVVLKGGTVQKVETGLMDYDIVEIKSGIDKNSQIELPGK